MLATIHEGHKRVMEKKDNTIIEGAFQALWKNHSRGMGESMGMRSNTSRAGSLRVTSTLSRQAQGESESIMNRIKTSRFNPVTTSVPTEDRHISQKGRRMYQFAPTTLVTGLGWVTVSTVEGRFQTKPRLLFFFSFSFQVSWRT